MLYILPPPRAPDPPSPWDSILCAGAGNASNSDRPPWSTTNNNKRPPKARLRTQLLIKNDDSVTGVQDETDTGRSPKSLSECYFAGKGAALVLPAAEAQKSSRRSGAQGSNIQKHLQSMFYLLRPEETLKMAVKLESVHPNRTRYLVVVSRMGRRAEESCLLGIDCNEKTTVGLVLRVLADTSITLDGDGGFSVSVCGRHHIFKPVSVQAMWSALQTLHKVSSKARAENYYQGGLTHSWVNYYEERIESDRSCLNEWHAMDNLESRRPPSPDSVRNKPRERDETEYVIKSTLKEIMMSVDLDEVTSKYIRSRLEEDLDMDLGEYKSFIDQEMLIILGQMDAPTEIFDHVYLGSEWNASNYEELQRNGVGHILNVTREIDNFFPGTFDYLNIRVYDDEKTDLLKHWDNTFKYISKARKDGSKVLVHCKMGVSRSASVVIAYAMKAYNWNFEKALQHVKDKRNCIKPNTNFLQQLEMYQGMLDAMKNKEKLQRSKSENNLKSPGSGTSKSDKVLAGSEPTPVIQALARSQILQSTMSGQDLRQLGARPKSWSPENTVAANLLSSESKSPPTFRSLENLNEKSVSKESLQSFKEKTLKKSLLTKETLSRNVLMPCDNGESYSVSPNSVVHLPGQHHEQVIASVKERVNELESQKYQKSEKKKLVLNLTTQFENNSGKSNSKPPSPDVDEDSSCSKLTEEESVKAQTKCTPPMLRAVLVKKEIWDPGEQPPNKVSYCNGTSNACDLQSSVSEKQTVWTSTVLQPVLETVNSAVSFSNNLNKVPELVTTRSKTLPLRKEGDPFSNQLDKVFDREERKQQRASVIPILPACVTELTNEEIIRECPSRQSSWSSYDSAVVLGYQGETRDIPSRHSSWGSGDTRTLPSRNSSWGSYDMRPGGPVHYINEKGEKILHPSNSDLYDNSSSGMFPYDKEDIPWYKGTVKRTKQKLEEGTTKNDLNESLITSLDVSLKSPSSETLHSELPNDTPVEAVNTVLINSCALNVQNQIGNSRNQLYVNNETSAISSKLDVVDDEQKLQLSRLSVSAPETSSMELVSQECSLSRSASNVSTMGKLSKDSSSSVISTAQCSSVKQHRTFLENLFKDNTVVIKKSEEIDADQGTNILGKVRNLKKEFEAKTSTNIVNPVNQPNTEINIELTKTKNRVNSLPSSPISIHHEKENKGDISPTSSDPGDFKKLIGKFEIKEKISQDSQVTVRPKSSNKTFTQNKNARYSCFEVSIEKSPIRITHTPIITNFNNKNCSITDKSVDGEYKRPPIPPVVRNTAPSVVMATVIAKAAKKQQQYGKSHPLARLNIKPRHNNPVYNTM